MNEVKEEKKFSRSARKENLALKDFHICLPPDISIKIKAGDDLSTVPEKFHQNLVTEGVMKGQDNGS